MLSSTLSFSDLFTSAVPSVLRSPPCKVLVCDAIMSTCEKDHRDNAISYKTKEGVRRMWDLQWTYCATSGSWHLIHRDATAVTERLWPRRTEKGASFTIWPPTESSTKLSVSHESPPSATLQWIGCVAQCKRWLTSVISIFCGLVLVYNCS